MCELLLRGFGNDIFQFIPEDLTNLLQLLRRVRDIDKDPISKFHAQNALDELSRIIQTSGENEKKYSYVTEMK